MNFTRKCYDVIFPKKLCKYIALYKHYIAKSIRSLPFNERLDYFSNFHEYKS